MDRRIEAVWGDDQFVSKDGISVLYVLVSAQVCVEQKLGRGWLG